MKDRLNTKREKIYHDQNIYCKSLADGSLSCNNNPGSVAVPFIGGSNESKESKDTPKINQSGGFYYLDRALDNRMSPWDEVPNQWDPIRLRDRYNAQSNPIVYQGFGIPLMSDLMCSSFAGLGKEIKNGNDRAVTSEYDRNDLGTLPSDKKSMFYFSDNISAPECCPGPYSSDAGCVCSFEKASF